MCTNHCSSPKHEKVSVSLGDGAGVREHIEVAPMHFWNAVWLATFAPQAGRELVRGLSSPSANVRAVAAMHLINGGTRAADILSEALDRKETLGDILPVVDSLQSRTPSQILHKKLAQLAYCGDPEASLRAKEILRREGACASRPK